MTRLLELSDAEFAEYLEEIPDRDDRVVAAQGRFYARDDQYFPSGREKQRPPAGAWFVWMLLAGRGFGKTRVGAEWIVEEALTVVGDFAVCAPTYAGARDTCIEDATSGVLSVLARRHREPLLWNRSMGELRLDNGSRLKLLSADEPDRARGWNFSGAWCDEIAAWRYEQAWHEGLIPAVRLGANPRVVVTTTPKPTALLRDLVGRHDGSVIVTRGSTWENADNLSPSALAELKARYAGTRLGRQELEGELLDDVEGALWQRHWIDAHRVVDMPDDLVRVVVAVDPALTASEHSDETGIVAVGRTHEQRCPVCGPTDGPHAFVLADRSCTLTPDGWARRAIALYEDVEADRMVAEHNAGGDLVELTIRNVAPGISYEKVHATRGKQLRAQPVAAVYEQGRVHHVGAELGTLEDQLCSWTPDNANSPDRLDALVHGITALGMWRQEPAQSSGRRSSRVQMPNVVQIGNRR